MSAVALSHAHAARGVNNASAKPGLTPGGSATPADIASFLDALDQALGSRQANAPVSLIPQLASNQNNGQNLPLLSTQVQNPANISDPTQLLMAQLMAQGLVNQNLQNSPVSLNGQNGPVTNQTSPINTLSSAQSLQNLMMANAMAANPAPTISNPSLQQFDPNQASMISIALAKALRASGKDLNPDTQNQAASLLAALQQASLSNQNTDQDSGQSLTQIATAIQNLAQKSGITLPSDLQQRLSDLASQNNASSIKLLGIQTNQANADANKLSALDLAKSNSAQNLADAKTPPTLSATIDKLQKGKSLDGAFGSNGPLAATLKNPLNKVDSMTEAKSSGLKGDSDSSKTAENSAGTLSDLKSAKETLAQSDETVASALANGMARADNHLTTNQHAIAVKAAEVSLASGPLHSEVMNAAKSGGGRILLELTPPEQGTIRIDLRISQSGQAHLIVEGASDATKSRLDQGGQNLKNEFAQMGLNLSLDLRQGTQSQQARDQGFANPRQSFYADTNNPSQSISSVTALTNSVSGDNRENSSAVHLYA
jgi:Flagellar hook-length control protein FliK